MHYFHTPAPFKDGGIWGLSLMQELYVLTMGLWSGCGKGVVWNSRAAAADEYFWWLHSAVGEYKCGGSL